jgi:ubiquinone/menaquinone biosynthesis C-methylase UbiE
MTEYQDQSYLLQSQYKDATNFSARVDLHRRFSVNKYGWHRWVFDQLHLNEGGRILELGCGPGWLWSSNRQRLPANWQITLSDFSPGMLEEARRRLGEERFAYQVVDAQAIPFADESFEAVIANHMLYHVPDLSHALAEICRVLKPGGCLYATTVGRQNMRELDDLLQRARPSLWQRLPFVLENGQELLAPFFSSVELLNYEDALEVTEAEPLVAYMLSGSAGARLSVEQVARLRALIQRELDAHQTLHLTKASGLFIARKA